MLNYYQENKKFYNLYLFNVFSIILYFKKSFQDGVIDENSAVNNILFWMICSSIILYLIYFLLKQIAKLMLATAEKEAKLKQGSKS